MSDGGLGARRVGQVDARWQRFFDGVVAAALLLGGGMALADPLASTAERAALLSTLLGLLVAHLVLALLGAGQARAALQVGVLSLGSAALVLQWQALAFVPGVLHLLAYARLPLRAAAPTAFFLGAVAGHGLTGLLGGWAWPLVLLAELASFGLAGYIRAIVDHGLAQEALVGELTEARARLAEAERRAGTLAERQRLSHELHDTVAQDLVSMVRLLEGARAGDGRALAAAEQVAQDALVEIRRLVAAFRSPALDEGIGGALTRLVERTRARGGVTVQLVLDEAPRALTPDVELTLYRVAQEALNNVLAHAEASEVTVTLTLLPELALLDVQDNGRGFAPDTARPGRFGLVGLAERARALGGALDVESAEGRGTTVSAQIPLCPSGGAA